MSTPDLTLHEAAEVLGVHYMTAYRYVRLGLLHATKSGGTWQVAPKDLEVFRSGAVPVEPGTPKRRAPWAARMEARLVAGDATGAWGIVEAALAAGAELNDIYLEVITPAMRSIGARWAAGELEIAVEHRASGIAQRLIGRLGPRFARRGRSRGTVLLGGPVGERHSLPLAMLADLLRGDGWEVSDVGVDLPPESFILAAEDIDDLAAIGVSLSSIESEANAAALCAALRAAMPGVPVVIGGVAVRDAEHAMALGATGFAASADAFAAQLSRVVATPNAGV